LGFERADDVCRLDAHQRDLAAGRLAEPTDDDVLEDPRLVLGQGDRKAQRLPVIVAELDGRGRARGCLLGRPRWLLPPEGGTEGGHGEAERGRPLQQSAAVEPAIEIGTHQLISRMPPG
jgi:hypothetical protein